MWYVATVCSFSQTAKTIKFLDDVPLMPCIDMPDVPDELSSLVFPNVTPEQAAALSKGPARRYGLYAVIVHTGSTANSGHYYVYARNSDANDLYLHDSAWNPWVKFNDTRVTTTTWAGMTHDMSSSVADTAYVARSCATHRPPTSPCGLCCPVPLPHRRQLRAAPAAIGRRSGTTSSTTGGRGCRWCGWGWRRRPQRRRRRRR